MRALAQGFVQSKQPTAAHKVQIYHAANALISALQDLNLSREQYGEVWRNLFSGAPIGTAVFLWTAASIAIAYLSQRIYWRGFFHDWAIGALLVAIVQSIAALLTHPHAETGRVLGLVAPQIIVSILLLPLFLRLTGKFDNFRLKRR